MLTRRCFTSFGLTIYLGTLALCSAQDASTNAPVQLTLTQPVATSTYQSLLDTFLASQQGLAQQMETLILQGATPQQMDAWQQQNAALLQTQQQRAQALAAAAPVVPLTYITDVEVPDDATPEMTNFLVAQANLANDFAELHNQQLRAGNASTSDAMTLFQQKDATQIQAQQQLAQVLAAQSAQQPEAVPPPLVIPEGSTPQMQAFLTLRDQLMREQIQLHNTTTTSSVAARDAALQQWLQQNAARFQQLQQLAQNLSAAPTNQEFP